MRFRRRHAQQTVADYVETGLIGLGWVNEPVNFGTRPVTFLDVTPDEAGVAIEPNTVAITFGDEGEDEHQQLGGGLLRVEYPVFCDVFGIEPGVSISIASDIKDLLRDAAIPLRDYSGQTPVDVDGAYIELESVVIERPPGAGAQEFRRHWRLVRGFAQTYFPEA